MGIKTFKLKDLNERAIRENLEKAGAENVNPVMAQNLNNVYEKKTKIMKVNEPSIIQENPDATKKSLEEKEEIKNLLLG